MVKDLPYRMFQGFEMGIESLAAKYSLYKELTNFGLNSAGISQNNYNDIHVAKNSANNSDVIISGIEDSGFSQKLFKHIEDHYEGKGQLSRDINQKLAQKNQGISNLLNSEDPKAAAQYTAYSTAGFSYSSKARFISGIDSSIKLSSGLKKIYA